MSSKYSTTKTEREALVRTAVQLERLLRELDAKLAANPGTIPCLSEYEAYSQMVSLITTVPFLDFKRHPAYPRHTDLAALRQLKTSFEAVVDQVTRMQYKAQHEPLTFSPRRVYETLRMLLVIVNKDNDFEHITRRYAQSEAGMGV